VFAPVDVYREQVLADRQLRPFFDEGEMDA
jgi:hypothetical protein